MKEIFLFALKILLVAMACYAPALFLTWVNFNSSKPTVTADKGINETGLNSHIEGEVQKQFDRQRAIPKIESSPLAKEYLTGQIKEEAKAQADKAAQDEISKARGELFGLISFPVLFAIASIFAAFAVKDILTEILKDQEKEKVKDELRRELKEQIVPNAIKAERITKRLQAVEAYTNLLEHELLNIAINQVIDASKKSLDSTSEEAEQRLSAAIEKLHNRLNITLDRVELRQQDLDKMRQAENVALKAKIKSLGLTEESESNLLLRIAEKSQIREEKSADFTSERAHDRMEEIFHVEMSLLIATLSRLGENQLSNEFANYIYRDRPREINERRKQAEEDSKQNPVRFE